LRRPVAVAITGGIGAGKSEALKAFARHGAAVVSSDEIVHHLLGTDEEVKRELVARFGHGIVDPGSGAVDRRAVASIVFDDPEALAYLESVLHPRVAAEYLRWRDALGQLDDPPAVCVTEVPLLYETGGNERFDKVVVITAPRQLRDARTNGLPGRREQRLIDDREKVKRADWSYVNSGGLDELDAFVAGVMEELVLSGDSP
jgi:dephospho-CoA kinase